MFVSVTDVQERGVEGKGAVILVMSTESCAPNEGQGSEDGGVHGAGHKMAEHWPFPV